MTPQEFIKQSLGIEIDEDNQFDDCELSWDTIIALMIGYSEQTLSEE